jgi:vacuolar-type H+-ATPase subunit F/Vma7
MSVAEFIGDELTAAGYRLCGIDVHVVDSSNALSLIEQACESASLVLIGSNTAARLDSVELERLKKNIKPPVLIVDDLGSDLSSNNRTLPDISTLIHKQLGMLE